MAVAPIAQQIDEVTRELSLRQVTHPGKVRSGQISKAVSEAQIERMESALRTLRFVRDNEAAIREKIGALPWR